MASQLSQDTIQRINPIVHTSGPSNIGEREMMMKMMTGMEVLTVECHSSDGACSRDCAGLVTAAEAEARSPRRDETDNSRYGRTRRNKSLSPISCSSQGRSLDRLIHMYKSKEERAIGKSKQLVQDEGCRGGKKPNQDDTPENAPQAPTSRRLLGSGVQDMGVMLFAQANQGKTLTNWEDPMFSEAAIN